MVKPTIIKQYQVNNYGERIVVLAYNKTQIKKHFKASQKFMINFCSEYVFDENRKIDLDLTGGK